MSENGYMFMEKTIIFSLYQNQCMVPRHVYVKDFTRLQRICTAIHSEVWIKLCEVRANIFKNRY